MYSYIAIYDSEKTMEWILLFFIPYGILCFLFMNLFGTIPRMRISPETYIWKIEKNIYWESEEDRKKHGTDVVCCVDFILGFSNGGNGLKTVYCGYAL